MKNILIKLISCFLMLAPIALSYADELNSSESSNALKKVLNDYIELYRKDSLNQWAALFHPSVIVTFPDKDGTVAVRNLQEFLTRQQNFFANSKSISERLENVQIFEGRRMARVVADFIFVNEGAESKGKLGLQLVESKDGWKIVAVIFSYDHPSS